MYSYIKDNDQNNKTAKGIKRIIIEKNLKNEDYKQTLFINRQTHRKMKSIRSKNHQLASYELNIFHCHTSMTNDIY